MYVGLPANAYALRYRWECAEPLAAYRILRFVSNELPFGGVTMMIGDDHGKLAAKTDGDDVR